MIRAMNAFKSGLLGGATALLTVMVLSALSRERALDLLALGLFGMATIYVGTGLADGRLAGAIIEIVVAVVFLAVAVLGRWYSPALLGAGWIAHGLWDAAHHPRGFPSPIPRWYPPLCLVYDAVVGIFILVEVAHAS